MKAKVFFIIGISLILIFCIWFFFLRTHREKKLIKEGNIIIEKIENYKLENNKLPESLGDIGIVETWDYPLYYQKEDSIYYILYFGMSFEENKTYYSDSKQWEDFYRTIPDSSKIK